MNVSSYSALTLALFATVLCGILWSASAQYSSGSMGSGMGSIGSGMGSMGGSMGSMGMSQGGMSGSNYMMPGQQRPPTAMTGSYGSYGYPSTQGIYGQMLSMSPMGSTGYGQYGSTGYNTAGSFGMQQQQRPPTNNYNMYSG